MNSDYYLLINGVTGESQASGMSGYIELSSFSFGASNPADIGGKGLAMGKASLSDFTFSCDLDSGSYQILQNLYKGQHIANCTFQGRKTGSSNTPYTYVKAIMTHCYVTSHSTAGGGQGLPTQNVSIAYEQIEFQYYTQDSSSGSVSLAGNATYNIAQVQAS